MPGFNFDDWISAVPTGAEMDTEYPQYDETPSKPGLIIRYDDDDDSSVSDDEAQEEQTAPILPQQSSASRASSPRPTANSRRSRRNSVAIACERCRRRKIRCSGLPGPCAACARLKVICKDPGKRKDRTQSLLEDHILRLETQLVASHRGSLPGQQDQFDASSGSSQQVHLSHPRPLHVPQIQTMEFMLHGPCEDLASPTSAVSRESFGFPQSPACYSDIGPEFDALWASAMQANSTDDTIPMLQRRSNTFPSGSAQETLHTEYSTAGETFSDIPSIEITSHDLSRPQSPFGTHMQTVSSPPGFGLGHGQQPRMDDLRELSIDIPQFNFTAGFSSPVEDNSEYYGDFLSPHDQPPPSLSRRSSFTSASGTPTAMGIGFDQSSSQGLLSPSSPVARNRSSRSSTMPSSFMRNMGVDPTELTYTLASPRTENYISAYFDAIHQSYPFLDKSTFVDNRSMGYRASNLHSSSTHRRTSVPDTMATYQSLMTAAIGSMSHHQSRVTSSKYVRLAMALQQNNNHFDMWSSVSGIHCALLLAIYLYLEQTMAFVDEPGHRDPSLYFSEPDVSHPQVNLWLHNCQIAAAIIDLGLHVQQDPSLGAKVVQLSRCTFCSAYVLDKQISGMRQRPRAFHDQDIDSSLLQ